jgi:hypothetical protein
MKYRSGWVAYLIAVGMLAFGCKSEPAPNPTPNPIPDSKILKEGELRARFVEKDGVLTIYLQKQDGTVLIVEPKQTFLKKDGKLELQPPNCPTCEGCPCRLTQCLPYC